MMRGRSNALRYTSLGSRGPDDRVRRVLGLWCSRVSETVAPAEKMRSDSFGCSKFATLAVDGQSNARARSRVPTWIGGIVSAGEGSWDCQISYCLTYLGMLWGVRTLVFHSSITFPASPNPTYCVHLCVCANELSSAKSQK